MEDWCGGILFRMRTILFSIVLVPALLLSSFTVVSAQSAASLQAELAALLAQLAALQSQLQTTTSPSPVPAATTGAYNACPSLSRTLSQGMSGADVTALQVFLATDSRIYPEGTISGYFGILTQYAVQRLQSRHGLVTSGTPESTGYGLVGPGTRNLIANVCRSGTPTSVPTSGGGCTTGGILVANGATADFYSVPYVAAGASCAPYRQTRQCVNGGLSGSSAFQYTSCTVMGTAAGSCAFNGVVMANGESRSFYRQEAVSSGQQCQSSVRTCVNGVVGGSNDYPYAFCGTTSGPVTCQVDGIVIPDGQSIAFYKRDKVLFGQSCAAFQGTRTCNGGILSGDPDYQYATCRAEGAQSCTVVTTTGTTTSTTTVPHGTSRNFWSEAQVSYTSSCDAVKLARTCNDGVLSGSSSYRHPKCEVIAQLGCPIDGITVAGGTSRTFYSARSVSSSGSCSSIDQSRTCSNGALSGSATYKYAYCAPSGQRYCVQDSAYVAHGSSKTFYTTKNPAYGSSCSQYSQSRSCSDGTLGGTSAYQYASCTEPTGASCTLGGTTVNHNQKHVFYSRSSSSNCAQYGQERTCIDGTLSGSSEFDRGSCTTASIEGTSQVAAALAAMEALLKDALAKLSSWF